MERPSDPFREASVRVGIELAGDTITVMGIARRGPQGLVLESERAVDGPIHLFDKTRDQLVVGK